MVISGVRWPPDTGPAAKMNNEINGTLAILRNAAGATGPKLADFARASRPADTRPDV
jgi:hypothetical protein